MTRTKIFAMFILAAAITLTAIAAEQTNPAGATLTRISSDTWSASTQTNAAGATAQIAGTWDASVDSENPAGAFGYIGRFDPLFQSGKSSGWLLR